MKRQTERLSSSKHGTILTWSVEGCRSIGTWKYNLTYRAWVGEMIKKKVCESWIFGTELWREMKRDHTNWSLPITKTGCEHRQGN